MKPRPVVVEPLVWTGKLSLGVLPPVAFAGKTVEVREVPSETLPAAEVDLGLLTVEEFARLEVGDKVASCHQPKYIATLTRLRESGSWDIANAQGNIEPDFLTTPDLWFPTPETAIRLGRGK